MLQSRLNYQFFYAVLGTMSPEDGLRKLRQMESTTGIWTMRCTMTIDRHSNMLVIIDRSNGVGITPREIRGKAG